MLMSETSTFGVTVAINALMASPTHRANIMNPVWRLVGVGAETSPAGMTIFTTIFAAGFFAFVSMT